MHTTAIARICSLLRVYETVRYNKQNNENQNITTNI